MKPKTPRSLDPTDGICAVLLRDIPQQISIDSFGKRLFENQQLDVHKERLTTMFIDTSATKYNLVRMVAAKLGWEEAENGVVDIVWLDTTITPSIVRALPKESRMNHFPGMRIICKKIEFALSIADAKRLFPREYRFVPDTYTSYNQYQKSSRQLVGSVWYIVKPDAGCMGKGVYLTHQPKREHFDDNSVLQVYVKNPLLIDGSKFDLRLFVVIWSVSPLTIYIHKKGFLRLSTEPYQLPSKQNSGNNLIHLTNYAIQRNSKKYVTNSKQGGEEFGCKRSLDFLWEYIAKLGGDPSVIWGQIHSLVAKSLLPVAGQLQSIYHDAFPDSNQQRCFEILGFDILIDRDLQPWLLEINHRPSLACQTDFDYSIKKSLVKDVMNLVSLSSFSRPDPSLVPSDLECVYPPLTESCSTLFRSIQRGLSEERVSLAANRSKGKVPAARLRSKSAGVSSKPVKRPQSAGSSLRMGGTPLLVPPKLKLQPALSSAFRQISKSRCGSATNRSYSGGPGGRFL
eukprot:TRINITY_DN25068_c0_g1_i1.p1 TRINITY_DN25068_c0_g1~~TRINITY_DN25068_c0_g1_i1.p1  ORF type:complete len:533 (+),score=62.15 TRINITY_DN25068_c0_g1_i1:65-1600(+)